MSNRNLINITNHPILTDVNRKAFVHETHNKYSDKAAVMTVRVVHFIGGIEMPSLNEDIYLRADNSIKVNPATFAYANADEDGNYPEGSVNEYDLLFNLIEEKNFSILELEDMFIGLRITEIDQKLYKKTL